MISTDFGPNEKGRDALLAFSLLFQPWRWRRGKELYNLKRRLKSKFFSLDTHISLFLTGRGALYQYLRSLNLAQDDEVLVQAFTCEAVVLPILDLGFTPVYVDITEQDYSIDVTDLKKKCSPKCKVLILQHTFGITPNDRLKILQFATQQKLHVIEDVAHGFDQDVFKNKRFTGAVLMSFGRSKLFSSVFGGAIATRAERVGKIMKEAERQLPNPSTWFLLQLIFYKILVVVIYGLYHIAIGKMLHFLFKQCNLIVPEVTPREKRGKFDTLMLKTYPNVAAIFMLEQLDRFNDVYQRRKAISTIYYYGLEPKQFSTYQYALNRFPYITKHRDEIQAFARKYNIYLGNWYTQVVAPKELDLMDVGYKSGSCPKAEKLSTCTLNLPTHISVTESEGILQIVNKARQLTL
ncbi:MAG: DegT/DnrJ/EryC1/StrS family aminotransferase [bacterium]|nr:DegT/DnrJ/EryC1/StrS family aminotransferase [bacterium]